MNLSTGGLSANEYKEKAVKLFREDRRDEAFELFDEAISCYPTDLELYGCRSFAYLRCDRLVEATEDLHKILVLNPYEIRAYRQLYALYHRLNDPKAAEAVIASGLRVMPHHPDLDHLACVDAEDRAPGTSWRDGPEGNPLAAVPAPVPVAVGYTPPSLKDPREPPSPASSDSVSPGSASNPDAQPHSALPLGRPFGAAARPCYRSGCGELALTGGVHCSNHSSRGGSVSSRGPFDFAPPSFLPPFASPPFGPQGALLHRPRGRFHGTSSGHQSSSSAHGFFGGGERTCYAPGCRATPPPGHIHCPAHSTKH